MFMRQKINRILSLFLTFAVLAGSFFIPVAAEAATKAAVGQEIEVTLAADTASNNLSLTGFADILKDKLNTKYGVPVEKIHVNAVESAVVSSNINWYRFDHTNYPANAKNSSSTGQVVYYNDPNIGPGKQTDFTKPGHIVVNGSNIDFYGYGVPAFKDFLFNPNNKANNKVFSFTLDENDVNYHSAEGAGFLFNAKYEYTSASDQKLSGYVVLIGEMEVYLYRLDNIEISQFTQEMSNSLSSVVSQIGASGSKWGGTVTCLAKSAKPNPSIGTKRYLKLAASPTAVSFYQFTDSTYSTINGKMLDNVPLDITYNAFGFGPIACYAAHSCGILTHVQFSNITMSEDNSTSFADLVKNTTWSYPGSFRVIANVDNDGVADFGKNAELATALYYMMQNSAHYVGWGVNNALSPATGGYNKVKDQANGFVARNNGRGTFINRSDATTGNLEQGTEALADYIAEQMGLMPIIEKPIINTVFDGGFLSNGNVTCSTPTVTTSLGNPVSQYQWRIMKVDAGTWENKGEASTTSLTFKSGSYNLVSLRVQDSVTKLWSDYAVAYIANDANAPPVSMFSLDKNELMPDTQVHSIKTAETVIATDSSYHPAGQALTEWEWKVYNSTLVEQTEMRKSYTDTTKPSQLSFDFSGKPAGKYTIKLRVKKGGIWSAYYSQSVTILRESDSIIIKRTAPMGGDSAPVWMMYSGIQNFSFSITSSDGELSDYRIIKVPDGAALTVGDWTPVNGHTAVGSGSFSNESYNVYVQARDVNSNSKTVHIGRFECNSVPGIGDTGLTGEAGATTATVSSAVYATGGSAVIQRGIEYWNTNDSVYKTVYAATGGTGTFTINLTGLEMNTTYMARGFATNSTGTAYDANPLVFTTDSILAIRSTQLVGKADSTSATVSADVYSAGKSSVPVRGIEVREVSKEGESVGEAVYAEEPGKGVFTVKLSGLYPETTYIVRGFATDATGTVYDDAEVQFTTAPVPVPLITLGSSVIHEASENDGSIADKLVVEVENGTFAEDMSEGVTVKNLPAGLGFTVTRLNETKIVIAFTGNAIYNTSANNVNNASITIAPSKISGANKAVESGNFSIQFSGDRDDTLANDVDALKIIYADGDSVEHVTKALFLPAKGQSGYTTITWSSSNTSLITNTGRVSRPEPEEADTYVTLTATIVNEVTNSKSIRTFVVKVLKLNDQDAAEEAAKNLTMEKAFKFANGDTWECITSQFFAVTEGDHGTKISWTSDNDTIKLKAGAEGMDAFVERPEDNNKNTILTAEISRGNAKVKKTFLLVVVKNGVSKTVSREKTERTAEAAAGTGTAPQAFTIERSTLEDKTKIDYVLIDSEKMQSLTDAMNPQNSDPEGNAVKVIMKQDQNDKAHQLALEIPANAVGALAERKGRLELATDEGSIRLEQNSISQMGKSGTDLFFRLVPINDKEEQKDAFNAAKKDAEVARLVGNNLLNIIGIPRKIETNYSHFETYVTLPLKETDIPTAKREDFLNSLRVFVEHSDSIGGTELLVPTRIVYEAGEPTGVEFKIDRFSRFQIVSVSKPSYDVYIPPKPQETDITIGGAKQEGIAQVDKTKNSTGGTDVTVTLNNDKLVEKLKNSKDGENVEISVTEKVDKLEVDINGKLIETLKEKNDVLVIKTSEASFNIPVSAFALKDVYDALGNPVDSKDVKFKFTFENISGAKNSDIQAAVNNTGAKMISAPIGFKIDASFSNKTVGLGKFGQYIEILLPLPKDIDPNKITTGVYVNDAMKLSHVPTEVTVVDGIYYAKINSLYSDGTHTVIWNPLEFSDVAKHWSKEDTNDMGSRTVVNGVGKGLYEPDRAITRAEFAAILARGLGLRPVDTKNPFTDVSSDAWYYDVVKTAVDFKLILGYGDGTFQPDKEISREEAMAMAARAMKLVKLETNIDSKGISEQLQKFSDAKDIESWAEQNAAACVKSDIIKGSEGLIRPKDSVTRAEVAAIIKRILKKANMI